MENGVQQCFKQISFRNNTLDTHKHYNDNHTNHYKSTLPSNLEHSSGEESAVHQQNKYDTKKQWNNGNSLQDTSITLQFTTGNNSSKKQILFNTAVTEFLDSFSKTVPIIMQIFSIDQHQ